MPDIIEENEGEAASAIARRALLARAAVAGRRRAANNNNANNNNANNNNANAVVAVPEPAAAAAAAGVVAMEVTQVATHLARLAGVDVRPMFRRLGVRDSLQDIRYIREKDLDGISRITPIQKRKVWAVLKYVATENPPLTTRTTLAEIAKTLNANKKKEKGSSSSTTLASTSAAASSVISKLDAFDGSPSNWVLWKNKSRYTLAQIPSLGALLQEGETGLAHAKKSPAQDFVLFNMLAESIVGGSSRHLIHKAEQQQSEAEDGDASSVAAVAGGENNNNNRNKPQKPPSGRILWQLLQEEYMRGPMQFFVLAEARQTLQNLKLVGSSSSSANNDDNQFVAHSAHDYVNRFRTAKDTLSEYKQALPDLFLASTFVEHIQDERLEKTKKQLLQDVSTKNLSLEDCIKELLMSDHIHHVRHHNITNDKERKRGSRKRALPEEPEPEDEGKRLKLDDEAANDGEEENNEDMNDEPDEATS